MNLLLLALEEAATRSLQPAPSAIPPTRAVAEKRAVSLRRRVVENRPASRVPAVQEVLHRPGAALDGVTRTFMESRFGHDFGSVRVHADRRAAESTRAVGAAAYTVGQHIVFAAGRYAPSTVEGQRLIAHELAHVVQQGGGAWSGDLSRLEVGPVGDAAEREADRVADQVISERPAGERALLALSRGRDAGLSRIRRRVPAGLEPEARESMREAARFLEALGQLVAGDMRRAEYDAARVPAAEAGTRARAIERHLPIVGQAALGRRLTRAREIYDAQRDLLGPDEAVQGALRVAYANVLHTLKQAFDRWHALAAGLPPVRRDSEQTIHESNLVAWLNANPFLDTRIAGRTAFTAAEATASATLETDVGSAQTALTARARALNLVDRAAARAMIRALGEPRTTVTAAPAPTAAPAAAPTGAVATVLQELRAWDAARDHVLTVLGVAIAAMRTWLAAPAGAAPAATVGAVQRYFRTTDTGYGQLLVDRLTLMRDQIEGRGRLVVTLAPLGDAECGPRTGGHAATYRVWLCAAGTSVDSNALTLLHEVAHAVIPALGSVAPAAAVTTVDRAYAGERLLGRLPTEEALSNAQSYAELAYALGRPGYMLRPIISDAVATPCTSASDTDRILDAMARAQSLTRRATSYIDDWRDDYGSSGRYPSAARTTVSAPLGAANDAAIDTAFADMQSLERAALVWHVAHRVACHPDSSAPCSADTLAHAVNASVTATRVTVRSTTSYPTVMTFCPAFLSASEDLRDRVAFAIVGASRGTGLAHRDHTLRYAAAAQAIWNLGIGAAPASSLAEHQAADAAARAARGRP